MSRRFYMDRYWTPEEMRARKKVCGYDLAHLRAMIEDTEEDGVTCAASFDSPPSTEERYKLFTCHESNFTPYVYACSCPAFVKSPHFCEHIFVLKYVTVIKLKLSAKEDFADVEQERWRVPPVEVLRPDVTPKELSIMKVKALNAFRKQLESVEATVRRLQREACMLRKVSVNDLVQAAETVFSAQTPLRLGQATDYTRTSVAEEKDQALRNVDTEVKELRRLYGYIDLKPHMAYLMTLTEYAEVHAALKAVRASLGPPPPKKKRIW